MQMHLGTKNQHLHDGAPYEIAKLEAAGYQWPGSTKWDGELHPENYKRVQARFSGGISSQIETRLQKGDKLYWFSDSSTALDRHVAGRWWLDEDTCIFLWSKAKNRDSEFRSVARAAFGVLHEWGDMGNLVSGALREDFWALKGITAPALSRQETIHNPYGLNGVQIFVPGGFDRADFADLRPAALNRL